jgi:chaperonin GroES
MSNNIPLQPLADRVIVEQVQAETTSALGIILPGSDKEKPGMGVIVAVGPGRTDESGTLVPLSVTVGQTIVFSKYSPEEVEVENKKYLIVREESILAIVN